MDSTLEGKKARLIRYTQLQNSLDGITEELTRRKNKQYIPAMPESDGSRRNHRSSDRMANAVIARISFEEKAAERLQRITAEMDLIENAVFALDDGLEQRVIMLRYITGTNGGNQPMPWCEVARSIYGDNDDAQMRAVFRVHKRALTNIHIGGQYADTN